MAQVTTRCLIDAPIERCFDLARSVDLHRVSLSHTRERAIAGVTTGLIGEGQEVTFSGVHFGLRLKLTSKVVVFDRPHRFRDSQVKGAFARFDHDHLFERVGGQTRMTDVFDFDAPLGPIGRLVDAAILARYMTRLLEGRAAVIKEVAEGDSWRDLPGFEDG